MGRSLIHDFTKQVTNKFASMADVMCTAIHGVPGPT